MPEESMNQERRFRKIEEMKNYFIEVINRNELISKKKKKLQSYKLF